MSRKGPVAGQGMLNFVEDLRRDVVSHWATSMFRWDSQMISRTGILDVSFGIDSTTESCSSKTKSTF